MLRQVLYSLQLTTPEQIKANPRIRVNWALAVGKVCKGKLIDDPYEKNDETIHKSVLFKKGHWGLWAPNDPKAAGIPGLATDGQQPGNSPGAGSNPPPQAAAAPGGQRSVWRAAGVAKIVASPAGGLLSLANCGG